MFFCTVILTELSMFCVRFFVTFHNKVWFDLIWWYQPRPLPGTQQSDVHTRCWPPTKNGDNSYYNAANTAFLVFYIFSAVTTDYKTSKSRPVTQQNKYVTSRQHTLNNTASAVQSSNFTASTFLWIFIFLFFNYIVTGNKFLQDITKPVRLCTFNLYFF